MLEEKNIYEKRDVMNDSWNNHMASYAPDTSSHVYRNRVDGVVDTQANEQLGESEVYPSRNNTNKDGSPSFYSGATSRNGDKPSQASVHGVSKIVCVNTGQQPVEVSGREHGRNGTSTGRQGGVDGDQCGYFTMLGTRNVKHTTRVETIPTEPEAESAKEL